MKTTVGRHVGRRKRIKYNFRKFLIPLSIAIWGANDVSVNMQGVEKVCKYISADLDIYFCNSNFFPAFSMQNVDQEPFFEKLI